jgi:hypothetical protein
MMLANLTKNRHTVPMAFSRGWMIVVPPILREECHYCFFFPSNFAAHEYMGSEVGCDRTLDYGCGFAALRGLQ